MLKKLKWRKQKSLQKERGTRLIAIEGRRGRNVIVFERENEKERKKEREREGLITCAKRHGEREKMCN